jgi:hypothetical protein
MISINENKAEGFLSTAASGMIGYNIIKDSKEQTK